MLKDFSSETCIFDPKLFLKAEGLGIPYLAKPHVFFHGFGSKNFSRLGVWRSRLEEVSSETFISALILKDLSSGLLIFALKRPRHQKIPVRENRRMVLAVCSFSKKKCNFDNFLIENYQGHFCSLCVAHTTVDIFTNVLSNRRLRQ